MREQKNLDADMGNIGEVYLYRRKVHLYNLSKNSLEWTMFHPNKQENISNQP